jgi:hypothetical protein
MSVYCTTARIVRVAVSSFVAALFLILLVSFGGRGEDPKRALGAYERYLPGNPTTGDVACRSLNEYPGALGEMCTLEAAPYCQRGYLIARAGIISYLRLTGCNFPTAYLMAEYGRPRRMTRFRRVVILMWEEMSAQLRNTGWFTTMQPVSSVGWWKG